MRPCTLGLLALLLTTPGCATRAASADPQQTLQRYAAAIRAKDAEAAYAMLSEQAKKRMTFEAFRRTLEENPEELEPLADALSRQADAVEVTATVTTPEGEALELVLEDGEWKADISSVQLYSQATPEKALRSFVKAFKAQRYDVLLRFAPAEHTEGLTEELLRKAWEGDQKEEMSQLVAALEAALPTARAEILGDNRATVPYGAAGAVQMLLEDGAWKIEEF